MLLYRPLPGHGRLGAHALADNRLVTPARTPGELLELVCQLATQHTQHT